MSQPNGIQQSNQPGLALGDYADPTPGPPPDTGNPLLPKSVASAGLPVSPTATQGGSAGAPQTAYQWKFQTANTSNSLGAFGSFFQAGTFGGVVETDWLFGYNVDGAKAAHRQGFFAILPDCGDVHGLEIEAQFVDDAGHTTIAWQFIGRVDGTRTGQHIWCLPTNGGPFLWGIDDVAYATLNLQPTQPVELLLDGNKTGSFAFLVLDSIAGTAGSTISFRAAGAAAWSIYSIGTPFRQLIVSDDLSGVTAMRLGSVNHGDCELGSGLGVWAHAPPAAQPAAPVTLADVIAIIRGCGLSA